MIETLNGELRMTQVIVAEVTKEQVIELLNSKPMAVVRAIEAIYDRQTADEQSEGSTKHSNGVEFNGTDANILSSFARQIAQWREEKALGTNRYSFPLSPRQLALAQRKIVKYAGQLARIANDRIEAAMDVAARAERDEMLERQAIMEVERETGAIAAYEIASENAYHDPESILDDQDDNDSIDFDA